MRSWISFAAARVLVVVPVALCLSCQEGQQASEQAQARQPVPEQVQPPQAAPEPVAPTRAASARSLDDERVLSRLRAFGSPAALEKLSADERAIYGNRAAFFAWTPVSHRPDRDWRSVLDPSVADAEPQWSLGLEEVLIRDYFGDKRDGYFVDVGCYRPKFGSTTYYLERELGWSGLGIDAVARYAQLWQRHRPRSKFLARAVSDRDDEMVTFHLGNVSDSLDEAHVKSFGGKKGEVQVKTITLDSALELVGIEKIDFLSMDIEGGEPAALAGFDIRRFAPDLCCVEAMRADQVLPYFAKHDYELIEKYKKADKTNFYFRPRQK